MGFIPDNTGNANSNTSTFLSTLYDVNISISQKVPYTPVLKTFLQKQQ